MDMSAPDTQTLQQQATDWFARLRGTVDAETQAAFALWQAADPAHAAAYARVVALWDDPDLAAALFASAAAPRRVTGMLRRIAAVALLLMGIGGTLHLSGAIVTLTADHVAGAGLPQRVTLEDGSLLLLDAGSAVDIDYSAKTRGVTLQRGRVLADVRPDKARPFIVTARGVTAQALGTVYSVTLGRDGATAVAVREGVVLVGGADKAAPMVLRAGDSATIGVAAEAAKMLDESDGFAWADGRLVFTNRPLGDVVAQLDRYWGGQIWVRGDDLAGLRVSGSYRLNNPPEVVAALAAATGAQVASYAGMLLILSR
jgi:transmembrane sensor